MTRYFIFISFRGTSYHGWQIQPNSVTIQKILENALSCVLSEEITTTGAGRTDAGVHALFFCAHFDYSGRDISRDKDVIFKLNRFLPDDIAVSEIRKVKPEAHARFSAISRTYKYFISRVKDPFSDNSSLYIYGNLNVELMNKACQLLIEAKDFTSFSRLHSDNKTNICMIYSASWEDSENKLVFKIRADRFLRNMVRAIVGTIIDVGKGKLTPEGFGEIIESKNRGSAGMSAPAKGLFLTDIEYPVEIFD